MNACISRRFRTTLGVGLAVAAFSACSSDEPTPLGTTGGGEFAVGVDLSSATAAPGTQIGVAVRADNPVKELGALQGTLHFDASRLRYVGQGTEGSKVTMINSSKAAQGELRLVSWDVAGINSRSGVLVFEVKDPVYNRGLSFDLELASDKAGKLEIRQARAGKVEENAALVLPGAARPMALRDWNEAIAPGQAAAEEAQKRARINLPTLANVRFGNANLSAENGNCGVDVPGAGSSVNALDALFLANISVANNSVLDTAIVAGAPNGRDPILVGNVAPVPNAANPYPGVNANGSRSIDALDLLAVSQENVAINHAVVCTLVPKPNPSGAPNTITGSITHDTTWTAGAPIRLDGIVRVTGGATLTIDAGARIEGLHVSTAGTPSALYIERDGRIMAIGSPAAPIIFTCNDAVKTKGCWGGVVILGSAHINGGQGTNAVTAADSPTIPGRATTGGPLGNGSGCLAQNYEGSQVSPLTLVRFGGCNDADSSGVVKFARFEYGGFQFQPNSELNNLTLGGVGNKTVFDYIQVHGGLDDGLEIFGGTLNVRHLLSTANSDDAFDYSQGWDGNAQFVIVQQDSADGDKSLEIDNAEPPNSLTLTPLTTGTVWNLTLIGKINAGGTTGANAANDVQDGINLRRGAKTPMHNMVMMGYPSLMDLDDDATCTPTPPAWDGVVAANFVTINNADAEGTCGEEAAYFASAASNTTVAGDGTTIIRAPYNVMAPDFRPVSAAAVAGGLAPSGTGIDATATYKGAVNPANGVIPWYLGWSRVWTSATTP